MNIDDFKKLKDKLEAAKQKKAKAEGFIEATLKKLKEEFGCSSLEEAEKKLESLNAQIEKEEKQLDKLLDKIDKAVEWDKI